MVIIWDSKSAERVETLVLANETMNSRMYVNILTSNLKSCVWSVFRMYACQRPETIVTKRMVFV